MEAWTNLYTELVGIAKAKLPEIEWLDLWHDQVGYLTAELPFPSPALFFSFNVTACDDKGLLQQDCDMSITMYLFFETFSDTYDGAFNQAGALDFLTTMTKIHQAFHGKSGVNFGTLRRTGMKQEESGGAGNLYSITFASIVEDASATPVFDSTEVNEVTVDNEPFTRPSNVDTEPLYHIQT